MTQPRKLLNGKTAHWMTFTWRGKRQWKHGGFNQLLADREERRIRAAIGAGTYVPEASKFVCVDEWFETWLDTRTGRAAELEGNSVRDHVLAVEWFARMRLVDVRPRDCLQVVLEMRAKNTIGEKYIANIWSVVRGGFERAKFEELRLDNPAELPKGTIKRTKIKKRFPYHRQEIRQLLGCAEVSLPMQVFDFLLAYTGMRKGEVCGRRFRHWATNSRPLGALLVDTQYDDQPLKGDDEEMVRPRVVPVHPRLAAKLTWWRDVGFELVFLRKPTEDDFIVPTSSLSGHTATSSYKAFQTALRKAGVTNRTMHSMRHTFISVARSSGVDRQVLEAITHNAAGKTIDDYTEYEWETLCAAVEAVDYDVDRNAKPAFFMAPTLGLEESAEPENTGGQGSTPEDSEGGEEPLSTGETRSAAALVDASQRELSAQAWALGLAAERVFTRVASGTIPAIIRQRRRAAG